MPNIFGGGVAQPVAINLLMQVATVGPITPSATLGVYGTAATLGNPRGSGGIIPLAIKAVNAGGANAETLNIVPTWSDGSTSTGLLWTPFTAALVVMQAGILIANLGSIPEVDPGASQEADMYIDAPVSLEQLFKQGLSLTSLAFKMKSAGALDAGAITITYWGIYT